MNKDLKENCKNVLCYPDQGKDGWCSGCILKGESCKGCNGVCHQVSPDLIDVLARPDIAPEAHEPIKSLLQSERERLVEKIEKMIDIPEELSATLDITLQEAQGRISALKDVIKLIK